MKEKKINLTDFEEISEAPPGGTVAKTQFAIFRLEKRTDLGQITRSNKHNFRDQRTLNADPNKPPPQLLFGARDLTKAVKAKLPSKVRKNAVLAVECMLTASPEFFARATEEQRQRWIALNLQWLHQQYGENLVQVVAHDDESTFHLHAYWVPLKDGKLNYFAIQGTPKHLVDIQTSYAASVAELGLARGLPNSQRRHEHHSAVVSKLADANRAILKAAKALRTLTPHVTSMEGQDALKTAIRALVGGKSPKPRRAAVDSPEVLLGRSPAARCRGLEEVRPQGGLRLQGP